VFHRNIYNNSTVNDAKTFSFECGFLLSSSELKLIVAISTLSQMFFLKVLTNKAKQLIESIELQLQLKTVKEYN